MLSTLHVSLLSAMPTSFYIFSLVPITDVTCIPLQLNALLLFPDGKPDTK